MTTPSRAAEIRRRWARSRKVSTLRRQYQSAKSESDKRSVLDKLARLVPHCKPLMPTSQAVPVQRLSADR